MLVLPVAIRPMRGDAGLYSYLGQRMLHGDALFKDMWDLKPPAFPALFAFSLAMFNGHPIGPPLFEMVLVWFGALGIFRVSEHFSSRFGAWISATLYIVIYAGLEMQTWNLQAESLAVPFLIWPFALVIQKPISAWRALLSGAMLGYAACMKTSLIAFVIPWAMMAGIGTQLILAALGGAAVIGSFAWYLAAKGSWEEASYTLFVFGPIFARARHLPFQFAGVAGGLVIATVLNIAGGIFSFTRKPLLPICVASVIAAALVLYQSTFYPYHWIICHAFTSIAFGRLAMEFVKNEPKRVPLWAAAFGFVLLIPKTGMFAARFSEMIQLAAGTLSYEKYADKFKTNVGKRPVSAGELIQLANRIKAATSPDDYVWTVRCSPTVAFWAERKEPVRFIYYDPVMINHPRLLDWRREYEEQVIARRPKLIVVCRQITQPDGEIFDRMQDIKLSDNLEPFFKQNYVFDYVWADSIEVYKLKSSG